MRFSIFSVLDYYADGSRTIAAYYEQLLDQIVYADQLGVLPVQKPMPRHWFSAVSRESFAMRGRAAQPIINLPHLTADSLQTLGQLVEDYHQHYLAAGGDANQYELPLIFYTCVAATRDEARQEGRDALQRYLVHQHHDASSHIHHKMHQLEERNQLLFGTPGDIIHLIKQYQASVDNRHFVFWLDFGGMKPKSVHRSMQLLAREVISGFS